MCSSGFSKRGTGGRGGQSLARSVTDLLTHLVLYLAFSPFQNVLSLATFSNKTF